MKARTNDSINKYIAIPPWIDNYLILHNDIIVILLLVSFRASQSFDAQEGPETIRVFCIP